MKKLVIVLIAMIGFVFVANAQSCRIQGLDDGSTCEVTNNWKEGGTVFVNVENDSEKTCANVTVKVLVTYVSNSNSTIKKTKEFTGRGKSCPSGSARIEVSIDESFFSGYSYKTYDVTGISGAKCN